MIITKYKVLCIYRPDPSILEGFEYDMVYRVELCEREESKYARLFMDDSGAYETCSMKAFRKHFKILDCKCEAIITDECICGAWD